MPKLEVFFDCSSPWTYLAFHGIEPLATETGADRTALLLQWEGDANVLHLEHLTYEAWMQVVPGNLPLLRDGLQRTVLEAGLEHGLTPKIHADEFQTSGGAELAVKLEAASADHLGAVSDEGIEALGGGRTVATLLPGTLMFLGRRSFAPARRLIEAGATVALATDFNPGSSPTVNMQLVMSLACSQMRMSPGEAFLAATVGGAAALRFDDGRGTLVPAAPADIAVFDVPDFRLVPYYYGSNHCVAVWKRGRRVL